MYLSIQNYNTTDTKDKIYITFLSLIFFLKEEAQFKYKKRHQELVYN